MSDDDARAGPGHDASLAQIEQSMWSLLTRAVRHPSDDWHWPVLASTDARPPAAPQADARVVVLRGIDAQSHELEVHSDARAHKLAQLEDEPLACLVFHDRTLELQLRVQARAHIHMGDARARAAWAGLRVSSQQQYRAPRTPGDPLQQADPNHPETDPYEPADKREAAGFAHFACIVLQAHSMEWLRLDRNGHERARFTYDPHTGACSASWIRP